MSGRRQHLARRIAKAQVKSRVIWIALPAYALDHVKDKLPHGVSWHGDPPVCYAKDATTGVVVGVIAGAVSTAPPKADSEREAKRLLDEAVQEHGRLTQQSITKMRASLERQGQDPDEVIRLARERQTAEQERAARTHDLARRLEDAK